MPRESTSQHTISLVAYNVYPLAKFPISNVVLNTFHSTIQMHSGNRQSVCYRLLQISSSLSQNGLRICIMAKYVGNYHEDSMVIPVLPCIIMYLIQNTCNDL